MSRSQLPTLLKRKARLKEQLTTLQAQIDEGLRAEAARRGAIYLREETYRAQHAS